MVDRAKSGVPARALRTRQARHAIVALVLSLLASSAVGCASAASDPGVGPFVETVDLAARRDAGPRDLASVSDLASLTGEDLSMPGGGDDLAAQPDDLAGPSPDLTGAGDLALKKDLSATKDLAIAPDLSAQPTPDLAAAPDLAAPKDLASPPDLAKQPGDMAGTCVPQTMPCDLVCQNCPQMQKCTFDGNHNPSCFFSGTVMSGQKCGKNLLDDCVAGDTCVTVSTYGACFKFCRSDADCPGGGTCTISLQKTTQKVCTEAVTNCTIVPPLGCGGGTACYAVTSDGKTGCHASGSGGDGALCSGNYDCKAGFDCVDTTGFGFPTCQQVCRSGNDADCTVQGQTCHGIKGWANGYGACF